MRRLEVLGEAPDEITGEGLRSKTVKNAELTASWLAGYRGASALMFLALRSGGAKAQTLPDPGPQCFMFEPPPGWMPGDTQTVWPYDATFQPLLRVNASLAGGTTAKEAGQNSAAAAIASHNA